MKAVLFCLLIVFSATASLVGQRQQGAPDLEMVCDCPYHYDTVHHRWVYTKVEEPPVYPDGDMGLLRLIQRHVKWPGGHYCATGRVVVSIIVEKNGVVKDKKILGVYGLGNYGWDKAIISALNPMQSWQPGMCEGEEVPVRVIFPIWVCLE